MEKHECAFVLPIIDTVLMNDGIQNWLETLYLNTQIMWKLCFCLKIKAFAQVLVFPFLSCPIQLKFVSLHLQLHLHFYGPLIETYFVFSQLLLLPLTLLTPRVLFPLAVRPRFTQPSKMRKRVIARPVGSSVRLKCTASGNPRPDIVWLKDSRPLVDESGGGGGAGREEGKKKKWTLSLKNLTPEQSGKYTCHVSNRAGEINATYKVEVIRESL